MKQEKLRIKLICAALAGRNAVSHQTVDQGIFNFSKRAVDIASEAIKIADAVIEELNKES